MPMSPVDFAQAFSTGLVAFSFALSGATKLGRTEQTVTSMAALRVPATLRRTWIAALLPAWELLLAAALLFGPGWVGIAAATAAAATLAVFTVLLVRVLRRGEEVDCGCFGPLAASDRVTGWSVARNLVLLAASIVAACGTVLTGSPAVPPPQPAFVAEVVSAEPVALLSLLLAWAVVAIVVLLHGSLLARRADLGTGAAGAATGSGGASGSSGAAATAGIPAAAPASMGDRIPDVEVVDAQGVTSQLNTLGRGAPVLLVFLSAECGSCGSVAERLAGWSEGLGPVLLRVATSSRPDQLRERMPQVLPFAVFGSREAKRVLGIRRTPGAVLLGGHQLPVVASPVVHGLEEIEALVRGTREAQG